MYIFLTEIVHLSCESMDSRWASICDILDEATVVSPVNM
jgi:hypothetical protein